MATIQSDVELEVRWARELYIVSENTLAVADHRRSCWICGKKFEIGQGMTVASTDAGNKLMHSSCFKNQAEYKEAE